MMTVEELDRIYKQNLWLISKRAGSAGIKALTFGSESLEKVIDEIALSYGLSEADKATLRPDMSIDAQEGMSKAADLVIKSPQAFEMMSLAKTAHQSGKKLEAAKGFIAGGMDAAKKAATVGGKAAKGAKVAGKVAEKSFPWLRVATAAYGAGAAGYLLYGAQRYNLDCYKLLHDRIVPKESPATVEQKASQPKVRASTPKRRSSIFVGKFELPTKRK